MLKALESDRARIGSAISSVEAYGQAILAARERIAEVQALAPKVLRSREGEVVYFREVWPRVFGFLFYCQRVQAFLLERGALPPEGLDALVRREEGEAARFFRVNREFWLYYSCRSAIIDGQFTREYSHGCTYDPLCLVIDPAGATLASYRAAWGLALGWYVGFLGRQKKASLSEVVKQRYEWRESRSAAVEWIKAQAEAESIYINGEPATTAQLTDDFEARYNVDLRDFNKLLYVATGRKKDPTPYLTKLVNAFKGRRARLRK